jgi:hypothetical protein
VRYVTRAIIAKSKAPLIVQDDTVGQTVGIIGTGAALRRGGKPKMSKFDYNVFYGGYDAVAVSKEKYSKEEAIEIAKQELRPCGTDSYTLAIGNGFVRHRAGVNEDGEPCVGWWLEYSGHKRSCPVWVFHVAKRRLDSGYEHVTVAPEREKE